MEFERIEDDLENRYFYQKRNKNTNITICLYSVIYGTRIRVYQNEYGCEVDYCGGSDQEMVEHLYSLVETILTEMNEKDYKFFFWPTQRIKPMQNDPRCYKQLIKLVKGNLIEEIKFPDVNLFRIIQLNELLSK